MKQVTIYTDGSTLSNPGAGGWAVLIEYVKPDGEIAEKILTGGCANATNNQMEFQAIVEGLSALKTPCRVKVVTDSMVAATWVRKNPPSANAYAKTLKKRLEGILFEKGHILIIEQIKGHNGHAQNERVDALAYRAAKGAELYEKT